MKQGGEFISPTEASGFPREGEPGRDGYGQIKQGFLELANVDLAEELLS